MRGWSVGPVANRPYYIHAHVGDEPEFGLMIQTR